eukprot:2373595-Rhodomonas_salina.5
MAPQNARQSDPGGIVSGCVVAIVSVLFLRSDDDEDDDDDDDGHDDPSSSSLLFPLSPSFFTEFVKNLEPEAPFFALFFSVEKQMLHALLNLVCLQLSLSFFQLRFQHPLPFRRLSHQPQQQKNAPRTGKKGKNKKKKKKKKKKRKNSRLISLGGAIGPQTLSAHTADFAFRLREDFLATYDYVPLLSPVSDAPLSSLLSPRSSLLLSVMLLDDGATRVEMLAEGEEEVWAVGGGRWGGGGKRDA